MPGRRFSPLSALGAGAAGAEHPPVAAHVARAPVAVRLAAEARVELLVIGRREALVVPDHARDGQVEAAAQPAGEANRGGELLRPPEDIALRVADVLDPDGHMVQPDHMPA